MYRKEKQFGIGQCFMFCLLNVQLIAIPVSTRSIWNILRQFELRCLTLLQWSTNLPELILDLRLVEEKSTLFALGTQSVFFLCAESGQITRHIQFEGQLLGHFDHVLHRYFRQRPSSKRYNAILSSFSHKWASLENLDEQILQFGPFCVMSCSFMNLKMTRKFFYFRLFSRSR